MTLGTESQRSLLAGDSYWYLGPSVLLGFSCRHKRILLCRRKREWRGAYETQESLRLLGGFLIAKVMRAWAQYLFTAALLPGWRHQEGELPMSPTATGKVTFLPVLHKHEAGQIAKQG